MNARGRTAIAVIRRTRSRNQPVRGAQVEAARELRAAGSSLRRRRAPFRTLARGAHMRVTSRGPYRAGRVLAGPGARRLHSPRGRGRGAHAAVARERASRAGRQDPGRLRARACPAGGAARLDPARSPAWLPRPPDPGPQEAEPGQGAQAARDQSRLARALQVSLDSSGGQRFGQQRPRGDHARRLHRAATRGGRRPTIRAATAYEETNDHGQAQAPLLRLSARLPQRPEPDRRDGPRARAGIGPAATAG